MLARGWSSTDNGLRLTPRGLRRWISIYFCSIPDDEQKSHLELRNVTHFPINISINGSHSQFIPRKQWSWNDADLLPRHQSRCYWPRHTMPRLWINRPFRESVNNRLKPAVCISIDISIARVTDPPRASGSRSRGRRSAKSLINKPFNYSLVVLHGWETRNATADPVWSFQTEWVFTASVTCLFRPVLL